MLCTGSPSAPPGYFEQPCSAGWVQILGKAEFLNPGGSVKDRVALEIINEALSDGRLVRGGLITEGTVGSTGTPHLHHGLDSTSHVPIPEMNHASKPVRHQQSHPQHT